MGFPSTAPGDLPGHCPFKGLQILQRDSTCLEEVRDKQARRAAEEVQQITYQPAAEFALVNGRLEDLSVPYFFHPAQGALLLEPVHERLHGGVRDAFLLGETLEDLAYRTRSELPALLQDPSLGLGQTGSRHTHYFTTPQINATTYRVAMARNVAVDCSWQLPGCQAMERCIACVPLQW